MVWYSLIAFFNSDKSSRSGMGKHLHLPPCLTVYCECSICSAIPIVLYIMSCIPFLTCRTILQISGGLFRRFLRQPLMFFLVTHDFYLSTLSWIPFLLRAFLIKESWGLTSAKANDVIFWWLLGWLYYALEITFTRHCPSCKWFLMFRRFMVSPNLLHFKSPGRLVGPSTFRNEFVSFARLIDIMFF